METGLSEYRFGRFTLQPAQRRLLADGRPAKLGARAFDVLQTLLEHRDRLLSKAELLDRVWPNVVVAENNLEVHIWALRKLMGAQAISTIPGRGYRFTLPLDDASAAPVSARSDRNAIASSALKTNLPARLPTLIGRADDMAALGALLDEHRFVTLIGAGGMGKTLLAQHLLDRRREALAHGVCWVELGALTEASTLVGTIAGALGIALGGGDPLQALAKATAPLALWLALDNAEHMAPDVAPIAEALLACGPGLRLLVTSQVPLKTAHERLYHLGPLATPDGDPPASEALRFGAVALFAERVRAIAPRFTLGDGDVAPACAICRQLDGSALAIELAAARAPLLGLPKLAESLDARLHLLTKGRQTAPTRQQTLRAALEWSHGLLDDTPRTVFRRLAVFTGGCSLDIAQQVLADDHLDAWRVIDGLDALVDRSLVAVQGADAPRYRLLESPHTLALERLAASGDDAPLRRRHAMACLALFSTAFAEVLAGRLGHAEMLVRLEPDLDNGRAALAWALQYDRAIAVALAWPLSSALTIDRFPELDRLWQATEACLGDDLAPEQRAEWALGAALHYTNRQPDTALTWAQRAQEQFRALGDPLGQCRALAVIAGGRRAGAEAVQHAALDAMRRLERPEWPPVHRMHVAKAECFYALHHGDLPGVEPALRRWLRLADEAGADLDRVAALINLADLALSNGDAAEAVRLGTELERQWRGSRAARRLVMVRLNLAAALLAGGDVPAARAMALAGWPMAAAFELRRYWADSLSLLAALEQRPRACAALRGYSDAAYDANAELREPNEARTATRAECLARDALGDAAFERLRGAGRTLHDDEVAAIAFAGPDLE